MKEVHIVELKLIDTIGRVRKQLHLGVFDDERKMRMAVKQAIDDHPEWATHISVCPHTHLFVSDYSR